MSQGGYQHVTRASGTILTAAIYNNDHQNHILNQNPQMTGGYSDDLTQMQIVTNPGGLGTESLASNLAGEIERLRYQIRAITGETQWYVPPVMNLHNFGAGGGLPITSLNPTTQGNILMRFSAGTGSWEQSTITALSPLTPVVGDLLLGVAAAGGPPVKIDAANFLNSLIPPATANPLMDGAVAVGVSTKYAREDHRHPTDTTRAPLASPTFTGDPKAPTPTAGDNDTSVATTAFVNTAIAAAVPVSATQGQFAVRLTASAGPLELATIPSLAALTPAPGDFLLGSLAAGGAPRKILVSSLPGGGGSSGSTVYVSDTPPAGAADNSLWWESDSGTLYLLYNDGNTTQWVAVAPTANSGMPSAVAQGNMLFRLSAGAGAFEQSTIPNLSALSPAPGDLLLASPAAGGAPRKVDLTSVGAQIIPQGRLTLTSTVPVMNNSVAGATTIYYMPYNGFYVPLWNGSVLVPTSIGAQLSNVTTDATKNPAACIASRVYDLFVWNDAGTMRLSRGPPWSTSSVRGTGAGTTELTKAFGGIWTNGWNITNGPLANRGTYVGTFVTNATSTIDWVFGTASSGVTPTRLGLWNAYNRLRFIGGMREGTASIGYGSSAGPRPFNNNSSQFIQFVRGLDEDSFYFRFQCRITLLSTGFFILQLGLDQFATPAGGGSNAVDGIAGTSSANMDFQPIAEMALFSGLGAHTVNAIETYSGSMTVYMGTYQYMSADIMY
jgi:hypothetical protein